MSFFHWSWIFQLKIPKITRWSFPKHTRTTCPRLLMPSEMGSTGQRCGLAEVFVAAWSSGKVIGMWLGYTWDMIWKNDWNYLGYDFEKMKVMQGGAPVRWLSWFINSISLWFMVYGSLYLMGVINQLIASWDMMVWDMIWENDSDCLGYDWLVGGWAYPFKQNMSSS